MWFTTIRRQDRNSPCLGVIVNIYCKRIEKLCFSSSELQVLLLFTASCKITAATLIAWFTVVKS